MDPVTNSITIGRPREEVFDYLADIANHPEFSDHYLKDWRPDARRLGRPRAGARFRLDAPFQRFGWADMTFIDVERPFRIVPAGRGGKFNRNKTYTTWTLSPAGGGTKVEYSTEIEPEAADRPDHGGAWRLRRWFRRGGRKALRALQSILEEDHDRGARATVAGV